jgi:hypothetical protein
MTLFKFLNTKGIQYSKPLCLEKYKLNVVNYLQNFEKMVGINPLCESTRKQSVEVRV